MSRLTRDDLVASHYTLTGGMEEMPRYSFAERVAAASAAGFRAIGLHGGAYDLERARGLTSKTARTILDDCDVVVSEVEFLRFWACDPDDPDWALPARRAEEQVWRVADDFGTGVVSVGLLDIDQAAPAPEIVIDRFSALCDRAGVHGLRVALEFMPFGAIPDVESAFAIVDAAEVPDAGVNVDAWHHFRGSADHEALTRCAERIVVVQLDDADADVVGDLFDDTRRRRYPGEGSFDLGGLLRVLDDSGVAVPLSVEILSPEHHALPIDRAARRAYDSARSVIEAARR